MAIVNAEVRFAPQLTAWFTANPTKVLQDGEIVYCSDGANIGKYVIGDNVTTLNNLVFYGGISSSGALTIGTTTITSGTNTRILYNNNGVVGEYLVTGTGTTAVLSTSPTITNINFGASTTLLSNYNIPSGVLKTTPVNGDVYRDATSGVVHYLQDDASFHTVWTNGIQDLKLYLATSVSAGAISAQLGTTTNTAFSIFTNNDRGIVISKGGNVSISAGTLAVSRFEIDGNLSAASWSLTGVQANCKAVTFTDTSAGGTRATTAINSIQSSTIVSSNASTYTDVFSLYIKPTLAGSLSTFTNTWALGLGDAFQVSYAAATGASCFNLHNSSTANNQNGFTITNANSNAASRNWAFVTNDNAYGDFVIKTSSTIGGNAMTGTRRLYINPSGYIGVGVLSPTAYLHPTASVAAAASLRLPHGTAPTTPNDGDMWTTTAGLFVRINGVTVGPLS